MSGRKCHVSLWGRWFERDGQDLVDTSLQVHIRLPQYGGPLGPGWCRCITKRSQTLRTWLLCRTRSTDLLCDLGSCFVSPCLSLALQLRSSYFSSSCCSLCKPVPGFCSFDGWKLPSIFQSEFIHDHFNLILVLSSNLHIPFWFLLFTHTVYFREPSYRLWDVVLLG